MTDKSATMPFVPFDPLEIKGTADAAFGSLKKEIDNILSSYIGWFDPFCELIQNALDAVEARQALELSAGTAANYKPRVNVLIDLHANSLTVSDNGIALDQEKFKQFLAPSLTFKSGKTRGHKGVGATYVAYGFNYMRISTKMPGYSASGRISGARSWLRANAVSDNPKIEPDENVLPDESFDKFDRGVSITVRFDDTTHPKSIKWLNATTARQWSDILRIKTGIGAIEENPSITISVIVVDKEQSVTQEEIFGTSYLWLHQQNCKKASFKELDAESRDRFQKHGPGFKMPDKFKNLDFIFDHWSCVELSQLLKDELDEEGLEVIRKYKPTVSVEYASTAKIYSQYNDTLGLRSGRRILSPGIQLAANNMPQGEVFQVPLNRNIGRQNQVHFLFHFDNYTPDLGRKGFHRELSDFAKSASRSLMEKNLAKHRELLKPNTGVSPDLLRELSISDWKKTMLEHETKEPLKLASPHFFKPVEQISITSVPTREQDVIALFHQLIAGGVIRGLSIMSTNERFTYDGLFRISFQIPEELLVFEHCLNPLGIAKHVAQALKGRVTEPRVLEYKYCLDGLIEDFDGQDKNIKDIDLCVCWNAGDLYKNKYSIVSILIPENADQRQYHGITHVLNDIETGSKLCDLIILSDLIAYLNDAEQCADKQRSDYE